VGVVAPEVLAEVPGGGEGEAADGGGVVGEVVAHAPDAEEGLLDKVVGLGVGGAGGDEPVQELGGDDVIMFFDSHGRERIISH
jgi:hypothetical protein